MAGADAIGAAAANPAASWSRSSSPSQRDTTIVATAFPMKLVSERHSLMNRSMPRISVMPATGMLGTTGREQPSPSSFCMSRGNALSDELVANTTSNSNKKQITKWMFL